MLSVLPGVPTRKHMPAMLNQIACLPLTSLTSGFARVSAVTQLYHYQAACNEHAHEVSPAVPASQCMLGRTGMALPKPACNAQINSWGEAAWRCTRLPAVHKCTLKTLGMASSHGHRSWLLGRQFHRVAACWALTKAMLSSDQLRLPMQLLWQGIAAACRCLQSTTCALQGS